MSTPTQTGYWDNMDNLDQELTLFVAANWTRFPDPDTPGGSYWYNQVRPLSVQWRSMLRKGRNNCTVGVCLDDSHVPGESTAWV